MKNSNILIAAIFLILVALFSFNFEKITGYGSRFTRECIIGDSCTWDSTGNRCNGIFNERCECTNVPEDGCPKSDLPLTTKVILTPNPFSKRLITTGTPMEVQIIPGKSGTDPKLEVVKYNFNKDGKKTGNVRKNFIDLNKRVGSFKIKEPFTYKYHFYGEWEPGQYAVRFKDLGSKDPTTRDYRYLYTDFEII